jgi:hypothetical protein
MAQYEVKVRTVGYDYYIVEAKSPEDALNKWAYTDGPIASETEDAVPVSATGIFEDDGVEYREEFEDDNEEAYV